MVRESRIALIEELPGLSRLAPPQDNLGLHYSCGSSTSRSSCSVRFGRDHNNPRSNPKSCPSGSDCSDTTNAQEAITAVG
jgi:hypothetical protein